MQPSCPEDRLMRYDMCMEATHASQQRPQRSLAPAPHLFPGLSPPPTHTSHLLCLFVRFFPCVRGVSGFGPNSSGSQAGPKGHGQPCEAEHSAVLHAPPCPCASRWEGHTQRCTIRFGCGAKRCCYSCCHSRYGTRLVRRSSDGVGIGTQGSCRPPERARSVCDHN